MKNKFRILISLLFFFFTAQVYSNPINKINFIGLNQTSESVLVEKLTFKAGDSFSNLESDRIIKELFQTGLFSNISIIKKIDEVFITVEENPYIKFFEIKQIIPNPWQNWLSNQEQLLSDEDFTNYINENNLSAGEIFSDEKFNKLLTLLEEIYVSSGFFNVSLTPLIESDSEDRIGIELSIDQGSKAKISSFKISGTTVYSQKELLDLFKVGETKNLITNYFTKRNNYDKSKIDQGIETITNHYLNSGYLDFRVTNFYSELSEDKNNINIEIQISEGTQFKLGKTNFTGELGSQSSERLSSLISLKKGEIFNRQVVVDDIQKIIDLYSDEGYAFVDVNPKTTDSQDKINLNIDISLNKKVYINRIIIEGNTRTQDAVIRREVSISEGGLYSRTALKKSILKLRRLGYFSDVQMEVNEIDGSPDKLNLTFKVDETKTGSINFSVSHSNNYGVSVGTGIKEKNIFGSGNTLNADFKLSQSYNRASFYFEDPYFNEDNHSINYGAFLSELNDDDIMQDSYEISSKGLTLGYGVPVTENTRANLGLEFSQNDIVCGSNFSTASYESKQCATPSNDEVKINLNWTESTLNDYMYPTDGSSNSISLDIALPIGDYEYYQVNTNHVSYRPVSKDITLKLTGNLNVASGYGGKELPFFKRLFAGGSGSLRGFGNKSLGPLYANNKAKGGELSVLGSANLIAPAIFLSDNKNIRMSAFIDTGNVYEKTSNINLDDLRMSTGIGFAYLSPIGPIGMYWSTPLLKKSGDIVENFSFSIGTGF